MGDIDTHDAAPRTPLAVRLKMTALTLLPPAVVVACCGVSIAHPGRAAALGWLVTAAFVVAAILWRRSPSRHVYPWWLRVLLLLVPVLAVVHGIFFTSGNTLSSGFLIPLVVVTVLGVVEARMDRDHTGIPVVSRPLLPPLAEGTWLILQGGATRRLNHHVVVPQQRGALDLVRLRADGTRARGICPPTPGGYAAYGTPVLAPCDGVVLRAVDGLPDQPPFVPNPTRAPGNSIRIDTGYEEVLLAHLVPGSVQVRTGDRVVRGQVVGEVGNSGNATEPHLHIHAERDVAGIQLRFAGVDEPLIRGTRLAIPTSRDQSGP